MNITGIIAEYNPFHQGHIYHIKKTREITHCDCLVAIITGYFSQRGLPSLMSKEDKTRLAIENGVDLVLELPVCFGSQSADFFAKYNIESLAQIPIDTLCFGSETNDLSYLYSALNKITDLQKNPSCSMNQNLNLSLGPNDILGIAYIKNCITHSIKPFTIQRNQQLKSATKTREEFLQGLSQDFDSTFHKEQNWDLYYPYLSLILQMSDPKDLRKIHLVTEGIENRLKENARKANTWKEFLEFSISKTYSRARIQRTCLMILLQIKKEDMIDRNFDQIKVLGFNEIGRSCLKQIAPDKIITKFQDMDPFLQEVDLKTLALYNSVMDQKIKKGPVLYVK